MNARKVASLLVLALLAGCGGSGGGGSALLPTSPNKTAATTKAVKVALVIPTSQPSSPNTRHPAFVSPSALGATVAVAGAQGGSGSATIDLSAGSSACTGTAPQRTCSASVAAPLDTDTFTVTLYDTAPVGGAIPSTAHVLGVGIVTQAITNAFTGSIAIVVGGSIATIGVPVPFVSTPADGASHIIGLAIAPTDFGNNPIGGATPAPYAHPIAVTLGEFGGSTGHMSLLLNGVASGVSATLTKSSDSVSVAYDGLGAPGYYTNVTLSAPGTTTQTIDISPLFVTSASTFFGSGTLSLNGTATVISFTTSEVGAPATTAVTATGGSGCTNIAVVQTLAQNVNHPNPPGTIDFQVTGGSAASGSGCSVAISDGTSTVNFDVVNTPVGGTIPLPGESIAEYTLDTSPPSPPVSPQAAVAGPDGRIWFSNVLSGGVAAITTTGVATVFVNGPADNIRVGGLATGSDGSIYAADQSQVTIDKINPNNGSFVQYFHPTHTPIAIAAGADGNVWFTESSGGAGYVSSLSPAGVLSEFDLDVVQASPEPAGIVSGPSGTMWFCDNSGVGANAQVDSVTGTGVLTEIASLPTACASLGMQSDGKALWVTSSTANEVFRIDTTTLSITTVGLSGAPVAIAAGADNAIYITEGNNIARISNNAASPYTPNEIAAPHGSPTGIALGADGRMWYGENGVNMTGALSP